VGVDLFIAIENWQVIDFASRSKIRKREKRDFEIRNRYAGFISLGSPII